MDTLITKCMSVKKLLVVAGCVPQGSRDLKELEGVSIVGVQQIVRVVEVVEDTLKGHKARLLNCKKLPALDLPKMRSNKFVEILPINVGCLGCDIGVNLPILLTAIIAELPPDGSTMLRIGMTNPPFILEHLKEIAEVLRHPCVYSFLHVPVQSGSDAVLSAMNQEYTVSDFRTVVDTLTELVPGMQIATDIICGFPGETDEDFAQTVSLIKEFKFSQVQISEFYPRPGTPAARMKKVLSTIVKKQSRELTSGFEAFTPYTGMEDRVERIWITEIAANGIHLVGHTRGYVQVLVVGTESMLGTSAMVKIKSVGRWSVFGEVIKILNPVDDKTASSRRTSSNDKCSPCSGQNETCACSNEPEPSACGAECCGGKMTLEEGRVSQIDKLSEDYRNGQNLIGWLPRNRKNHTNKNVETDIALGSLTILVSFLTIVTLLINLG